MSRASERRVRADISTAAEGLLEGFSRDELTGDDTAVATYQWEVLLEALEIEAMIAGSLFWRRREPGPSLQQEALRRVTALGGEAVRVGYPDLAEKLAVLRDRLPEFAELR